MTSLSMSGEFVDGPPSSSPSRIMAHSWLRRLSNSLHHDTPGYCTVGEPASRSFSLPPHGMHLSELEEDQTISPYASYTSLSERAVPIIYGWLDKLSPQGYGPLGLLLTYCLCPSVPLRKCLCLLSVFSERCVFLPFVSHFVTSPFPHFCSYGFGVLF